MINAELLETIFNKLPKREHNFDPIVKLTQDEFISRIKTAVLDRGEDEEDVDREISNLLNTRDSDWLDATFITSSDEVVYDKENCCRTILHEHNGFHFLVCESGGDWEFPICYIIYPTEDGFDEYIPEEGNSYNKAARTAFGSEGEFSFTDEDGETVERIFNELSDDEKEYFENEECSMLEVVGFFKATGEIAVPGGCDVDSVPGMDEEKCVEEFVKIVIGRE